MSANSLWAPRKLLSGLDSGGIMAIITQSDLIATVGQRGFCRLVGLNQSQRRHHPPRASG